MSEVTVTSPFGDDLLPEVPLASAPLALVLTQVRFPRLAAMARASEVIDPLAAELRSEYPLLDEQLEQALMIDPHGGLTSLPGGHVWKFRTADDQWQVSVADTFLTLHTTAYPSRDEVTRRLEEVWGRFASIASPPFIERIGARYLNLVTDEVFIQELPSLVRPEVLGTLATRLNGAEVVHNLDDALYQVGGDLLQVRTGVLPPGTTLDPSLPPRSERSWVLDLDASTNGQQRLEPAQVAEQARSLAARAYRYFRWATTPAFLARFGGQG